MFAVWWQTGKTNIISTRKDFKGELCNLKLLSVWQRDAFSRVKTLMSSAIFFLSETSKISTFL